jgi:hypothetical protein
VTGVGGGGAQGPTVVAGERVDAVRGGENRGGWARSDTRGGPGQTKLSRTTQTCPKCRLEMGMSSWNGQTQTGCLLVSTQINLDTDFFLDSLAGDVLI